MERELERGERLQIMLSPEELNAVDNFRFKNRMPSRAAAIRDILRLDSETRPCRLPSIWIRLRAVPALRSRAKEPLSACRCRTTRLNFVSRTHSRECTGFMIDTGTETRSAGRSSYGPEGWRKLSATAVKAFTAICDNGSSARI
jgi:hypothetical protein